MSGTESRGSPNEVPRFGLTNLTTSRPVKILLGVVLVFVLSTCAAQPGGKAWYRQHAAECQDSWPVYPHADALSKSSEGAGSAVACGGTYTTSDSASLVLTYYGKALNEGGWKINASDPPRGVIRFAGAAEIHSGGWLVVESRSHDTLMTYWISRNCPCGPDIK